MFELPPLLHFFLIVRYNKNAHKIFPIAFDKSAAVTEESTPPDNPSSTFSPFVISLISLIL